MFAFLKPQHCDGCTQPFPAHALVGIHGDWYCVRCAKNVDKELYYCDGCGEDYPITHLYEDKTFDGYFCKHCRSTYLAWCGICNEETNHAGLRCSQCGR